MNLQKHRKSELQGLTNEIGVYALCDLDQVPLYVGQSTDGIRTRVHRHLTSARSDVIANRQLDVWEIAFIWAWPMPGASKSEITSVEDQLIDRFHVEEPLMNGSLPTGTDSSISIPIKESVQILPDAEIERRKDPTLRLPRQITHFNNLFSHILEVKNNVQLRRTLQAHYSRLQRYYDTFLKDYDPD